MHVTTLGFAVFFAIVFAGAWLLRPWPMLWKAWLLLASVVFFGWWDWQLCLVLALVVVVAQAGAIGARRSTAPGPAGAWVVGAVAVLLATFVVVARVGIDGVDGHVVVPLGLALVVLRSISYIVDVRRGVLALAPAVDLALAVSFFPAIVAGPLVRPSQLLPQLDVQPGAGPPDPRRIPAARAFRLLVVGLAWLWVVAPYLGAKLVDPVFDDPGAHSALEVLVAIYGFTVQLFAYLAGYASMAIGASLLLGLRLPENFDAPFTATSLRQFWRRWTSTFSLWFRDYVYAPLGGSRLGGALEGRNLLVTMLLAGLLFVGGWSGLVWGAAMGAALAIERALTGGRGAGVVGWLVTFNVVAVGWTIVRVGDLADLGELLARLASFGDAPLVTPLVLAVIVGAIVVQVVPRRVPQMLDVAFSRLPLAVQALGLAAALFVVDTLGQGVAASTTVAL